MQATSYKDELIQAGWPTSRLLAEGRRQVNNVVKTHTLQRPDKELPAALEAMWEGIHAMVEELPAAHADEDSNAVWLAMPGAVTCTHVALRHGCPPQTPGRAILPSSLHAPDFAQASLLVSSYHISHVLEGDTVRLPEGLLQTPKRGQKSSKGTKVREQPSVRQGTQLPHAQQRRGLLSFLQVCHLQHSSNKCL